MGRALAKVPRESVVPPASSSTDALDDAGTSLTRLEAHAAARLDVLAAKSFDVYGLPVPRSTRRGQGGFSAMKSIKGLASYLTTRFNPSFQECLVRVVESVRDLTFEVRQLTSGKAAATKARILFTAPLSSLVDVVRDSVVERDTFVFAHLPSSSQPAVEDASFVSAASGSVKLCAPKSTAATPAAACVAPKCGVAVSKKEEIISNLFRAYGDIGLRLVFRVPPDGVVKQRRFTQAMPASRKRVGGGASNGSGGSSQYIKVDLRFISTEERNTWMTFCTRAYMGLLLDSIRTDRDTVYVIEDSEVFVNTVGSEASRVEKPPEEALEGYVDFFLSVSGNSESDVDPSEVAPFSIPSNGCLKLRSVDGTLHSRKVKIQRVEGVDNAGRPCMHSFFVLQRTRWPSKREIRRIPIEELRIYADNRGATSFYLEFTDRKNAGESYDRGTSMEQQLNTFHAMQSTFLSPTSPASCAGTVILECEVGTCSCLRLWLQWFEAVLQRPLVMLSDGRVDLEESKPPERASHIGFFGDRTVW